MKAGKFGGSGFSLVLDFTEEVQLSDLVVEGGYEEFEARVRGRVDEELAALRKLLRPEPPEPAKPEPTVLPPNEMPAAMQAK